MLHARAAVVLSCFSGAGHPQPEVPHLGHPCAGSRHGARKRRGLRGCSRGREHGWCRAGLEYPAGSVQGAKEPQGCARRISSKQSGVCKTTLVAQIINIFLPFNAQEMWLSFFLFFFFLHFIFTFSFRGCMRCISILTQAAPGDL